MKRVLKTLGWTLLAALLLGVATLLGAAAVLGSQAPFDHTVIRIDDTTLTLSQLGLGDWLALAGATGFGIVVAFLVLVLVLVPVLVLVFGVVVPLAVLAPLLVVALVLGAVVVSLAGAAALACSPLLLVAAVVWGIWRLARGPTPIRRSAPAPPTLG